MKIGVNEGVAEDHREDGVETVEGELAPIMPDLFGLSRPHAFDELHREHAPGRELGINLRDADAFEIRDICGEAPVVSRLALKIELELHRLGKALGRAR